MTTKSDMKSARKRAVYDLQNMLYLISLNDTGKTSVIPDGVYEKKTREAVRDFQRKSGLVPSGEVDYETWNSISRKYRETVNKSREARQFTMFRKNQDTIEKNGKDDAVYAAQILLQKLANEFEEYEEQEIQGVLDDVTERNIKKFQKACRMEQTGNIDKDTYDMMALYYNFYCK